MDEIPFELDERARDIQARARTFTEDVLIPLEEEAESRHGRLPDFAFFSHASHVTAGLACQTCHGQVQQMVRVAQQETMTMGWCLDCHRREGSSVDCGKCHY